MKHIDMPTPTPTSQPVHLIEFSVYGAADENHANRLYAIACTLQGCLSAAYDGPPIRLTRDGVHRVRTELRDGGRLVATSRPRDSRWCVHVDGRLTCWVDLRKCHVVAA